jgi:Tol biopolymer transport system component
MQRQRRPGILREKASPVHQEGHERMTKTTQRVLSTIWWLGKGTAMTVGDHARSHRGAGLHRPGRGASQIVGFPLGKKAETMKAAIEETTRIGRTMASFLALAVVLLVLAATADTAEAGEEMAKKIVFTSDRTSGTGVNNPTGDVEIFMMSPDGTELQQLTSNTLTDFSPTLSPDGEKIAFVSAGAQTSNLQGDFEIYLMNSLDGSDQQNLTTTNGDIDDFGPDFSPDGEKIAYSSEGVRSSNAEGDSEVYKMNDDGSAQNNLTDTADGIFDFDPDFSPDGEEIAFERNGVQGSKNPEGDFEIYKMETDGSKQKNLSDTGGDVEDFGPDFSSDGEEITYSSEGVRSSNLQGDSEVYKMSDDGSAQENLTDTADGIFDFEPDFSSNGEKIAYRSLGVHSSRNPEGDDEIYKMNDDGSAQENLTDTGSEVTDIEPDFGMAKK